MQIDYIESFRSLKYSNILIDQIHKLDIPEKIRIMEVCGGHTITILKYGLPDLLPKNIELISGPGCPVCVTASEYIDKAIELSGYPEIILTGYGDILRVPGSKSSLKKQKDSGKDIRICYSSLDALEIAKNNPDKIIVFLAIGFETTAPSTAVAIKRADEMHIKNFTILCAHKTMPEAMKLIASDKESPINGFILPGHVSAITGIEIFRFISKDYGKTCAVSGFEPIDILQSIVTIVTGIIQNAPEIYIQYTRIVNPNGNLKALSFLDEVFEPEDTSWKGLGLIAKSGLRLKDKYKYRDIHSHYKLQITDSKENPACICGEILKGKKKPMDCKLFAKGCNPEQPKGACMVSDEGTCGNYFKYGQLL